ncbi:MAG: ABC transporter ATP-binding protein [Chloroflexota bacterium]
MTLAVSCTNLGKNYGKVVALKGLDLEIPMGVVFGLLGPNGAGKTTTLKILTGMIEATSGEAWLDGVRTELNSHVLRERYGYLPEEPRFYPWLSGKEHLELAGKLANLDSATIDGRASEVLNTVRLEGAATRRVKGYSRGMRQRLGLANALIARPPILILDEPTSALDPVGRREVLDLIVKLRQECTIILSTHILADVEQVCDQVAVLRDGELIDHADNRTLISRFSQPVIEIELDIQAAHLSDVCRSLNKQMWITDAKVDGRLIRIQTTEIGQTRARLLTWLVESGFQIERFEVTQPSLEDVFIRLVSDGAA